MIASLSKKILLRIISVTFCIQSLIFSTTFLIDVIAMGQISKNIYLINNSIIGILLGVEASLVLPLLFKGKETRQFFSKWLYSLLSFCIGLNLILIILLNGRSAWVGLFVMLTILLYTKIKKLRVPEYLFWSLVIFILFTLMVVLFLYKKDSSDGRLLIYKISSKIAHDNFWVGIGPEKFKTTYNLYQADYFRNHNINGKEALLADHVNFSFNDYLQILTEQGVVGFILFLIALYFIIIHIRKSFSSRKNDPLFIGSLCSLIFIMITGLFSYPFEIISIFIFIPFVLSIIFRNDKIAILNLKFHIPLKILGILISSLLFTHSFLLGLYYIKAHEAFALRQSGFIRKSLHIYESISKNYIKDGNVLYQYAYLLNTTNELDKAQNIINETMAYNTSPDVYLLASSIAFQKKDFAQSEKSLLTAVYITPNRIVPRFALLNFYLETQQKKKALYWANLIETMPIKIPSATTSVLKEKVNKMLNSLQKLNFH
jgi:O-antigen ligase